MEQYADVQQLMKKEDGQNRKPIYPPTVIQAVFDGKTGASLEAILAQFNSIYVQYQGTPKDTRLIIPKEMRRAGLTITYMDMDSNTITERANSAVQKDNDHWGLDVNWSRVDELSLSGDISVSAKGTWIINGVDTGIKAVGPKGDTGLTPWLKTIDNKLHFSYDNVTWEPCSENIAAWFRWSGNKIQISRDNKTWTDLSSKFADNVYIKGYVATTSDLPSGSAQGDIYGVGPTYAAEDIAHTNPIYRYYVRNANSWVDNGSFTSISAGVVQETGDSETEVMSQKAVSEKLSELGKETKLLASALDEIELEYGTVSVETGNKGDRPTRFRTKDFIAAPFFIKMKTGYLLNYIYKYDANGVYVGYEIPSNSTILQKDDSLFLYIISFKREDNAEIVADDLKNSLTFKGTVGLIEKDFNNKVSIIKEAIDSITEDVKVPMQIYSEIESSYLTVTGDTDSSSIFSIRVYSCDKIPRIQLEGTGGGVAARYAFYSSADINSANAIKVGPQMSGEEYSEILNVPQEAKFFAVTYRTTWQQSVSSVEKQTKTSDKKALKILCFGNSFTLGSMGYSPFLLKGHYKEKIDLTIGIAFISGGTLGPTYGGVENQLQKITEDTAYTYWKYINDGQSWGSSSAKPSEMLADEDWDIVMFQQGSNNAPDYATYQPYLNQCIDLISQKVSKPVKIAWLIPHADKNCYTQNQEQNILDSAERVMNETITEIIIPYGTAIANARTTSLKDIGDAGNLLYEGKHLQNGLPMLVSNYCSMIVLLNLLGMNQKSIVGINSIEVNDAWVSAHNIPNASAVGNCVGVTSENCRIAEKCAIMAVKKPYSIIEQ